jgi:hypothetical protein|tara:strand:+ start:72 stop:608 length:537 start_codon:yes stop_codon:yes gene_type:complete
MSGGMGGGEAGVPDDLLTTKGDTHGYTTENARVPIGINNQVLQADSTEALGLKWATLANGNLSFVIACSDETTDLTTGEKVQFRMPFAFTVSEVRASLTTAATGASLLTVDIEQGGVSILSTPITIDASETTSTTAATPPVISTTALTNDSIITVDIDQIGNTTAGRGLKCVIIGSET